MSASRASRRGRLALIVASSSNGSPSPPAARTVGERRAERSGAVSPPSRSCVRISGEWGSARKNRRRQSLHQVRRLVGLEGRIAAEELVTAVAAQHDGHLAASHLGQAIDGQERAVHERLIEKIARPLEELGGIGGRELDLRVLRLAGPGYRVCERPLIVAPLGEAEN